MEELESHKEGDDDYDMWAPLIQSYRQKNIQAKLDGLRNALRTIQSWNTTKVISLDTVAASSHAPFPYVFVFRLNLSL